MYCRRCGASLHQGVAICSECGSRQRRGLSALRCGRCGGRVSLGLTVCPHCGRDVRPAGPRWGLWLAGFAVVALAALWGLGELPLDRIGERVASIEARVAGIVKVFGPGATEATATPRAVARATATTTTPTRAPTERPTNTPTDLIPAKTEAETPVATAASTIPADQTATTEPTAAATATETPTATPTDTPTLEPTATPTATATNTPVPGRTTYKVQSGDTLSSIATQFGIAWQDLAAANGLNSRSTLRVGQELIVPLPGGAAPASAPTAPQNAPTTYTVKSGDNLSTIAAQFGLTWQELASANGLTAASRLSVGQKLIIPGTGSSSQAAPTATAAVAAATARPTTASATAIPLFPAPQLVSPSDQTPYSGTNSFIELVWSEAPERPVEGQYQVSIRWVEGGVPMEYTELRTTATSIRMPLWLYGKADQPSRQYSWSVRLVQVVTDGQGGQKDILLSPSSATRVLYWN